MKLTDRTVLITGGTSGIGYGIAKALYIMKNRVIVCGRDPERLSQTEKEFPGITALKCDVGDTQQREDLAREVLGHFTRLDILINNAGVQRYIDLKKGYDELKAGEDEITVNFVSTVELTALFITHLMARPSSAIINVGSGLAFLPMADTPVYNATKAAIHTYTLVLRQQLRDTSVKVVEIVPPMVDTNLNREGRDNARLKYKGVSLSEYVPTVIKGLENNEETIFYGDGSKIMSESREGSENRLLKSSW
jgi:uncharacterized oxidoreductase